MTRSVSILLLVSFALLGNACMGQSNRSLSLELGGSAGLASINYEKTFRRADKHQLAYRIGFSGFPIDRNSGSALIFPLALQSRWGAGPHQFEAAAGLSLSFTTKGKFFCQGIPALAYRFAPRDRRVFYKIAYTPILSFLVDWQYQHWLGLTLGYRI